MAAETHNWWRDERTARLLARELSSHIVGLQIILSKRGEAVQDLFTGFLLEHHGIVLWVTAGHVIDEIEQYLSHPDLKFVRAAWLDGCNIEDASAVPAVDFIKTKRVSATEHGIDLGAISLENAVMMLAGNPKLIAITEEAWTDIESVAPQGLYLVGFPSEWWTRLSEKTETPRTVTMNMRGELACIPLERIEPRESHEKGDFWDHPNSFYARVLGATSNADETLGNIKGMSGGPIFAVQEKADGSLIYRLFAIQSEWLPDSRILRAEPIQLLAEMLEPEPT